MPTRPVSTDHLLMMIEMNDRRYGELRDDDQRAVAAALTAQREAVAAALKEVDKATRKSEEADEKRFAGVNELRGQLQDVLRTLMPRGESEQRMAALAEKIEVETRARIESERRMTDQINALASVAKGSEGRSAGINSTIGYLVSFIVIVNIVVGIVIVLSR